MANQASAEVVEDTVDLKNRLPKDMVGHRLYFVVQGKQLYVYLISQMLRPSNSPIIGPTKYRYYQAYVLYPKE